MPHTVPSSRFSARARPPRRARVLLLALTLLLSSGALGACAKGFNPKRYTSAPELFRASMQQMQRKKWDNALAGLDLLATQLPARDTLLARVYFAQGQAHARKGEHLLAAQAYARIGDAFPDDETADDALLQQGIEYQKLWRKPMLDTQYGTVAIGVFRQLPSLYPDSPLVPEAERRLATLNDWFARKDLETGHHYLRRKAYDSAVIYYKDVVRQYPGTPSARVAYLRLIDAYRAINYKEDVAETCQAARQAFPSDGEVGRACPASPTTVARPATP